MAILSIIGIFFGLIFVLRMPMPQWRLLAGLAALGVVITGIDLLSVGILLRSSKSSSILWMKLGGGALIGSGVGYFMRWIWLNIPGKPPTRE